MKRQTSRVNWIGNPQHISVEHLSAIIKGEANHPVGLQADV